MKRYAISCCSFVVIELLCLVISFQAQAQRLTDSTGAKIDALFKKWDTATSPGTVVAIVRNDSVIYQKSYGQANLELDIPNTVHSVYYICSLAKQFTAYSILLLAKQHKLSLDDDIRKYLPWMPDFGKKITVLNLLQHTSGIRDDLNLLKIAGIGRDGIIDQALALNILKRQRTLNFDPGEDYSYSNSNYILLAEIVEKASGQSFRKFTDEHIFGPLHMPNSHFYENPSEVIPGRVASYTGNEKNGYQNSFQNVYTLGDGGLFMPMDDMCRWVMNYFDNKIGDSTDIKFLNEKVKLRDGRELQGVNGSYKGWNTYQYNGGLNGFRTFITIFPRQKTGIIVFANQGDDNTYNLSSPIADLFITAKPSAPDQHNASPKTITIDSVQLKKYAGDYLADDNMHFQFYTENDKLYLKDKLELLPLAKDTFLFAPNPAVKIIFYPDKENYITRLSALLPERTLNLKKYDLSKTYTDKQLQLYVGSYFCAELDCHYQIILKNHQLLLTSNKYPDSDIHLWDEDNLKNDAVLGHLSIERDANHMITGFEVNNGNISHLKFVKLE